nr:efflux RND transporter periplasmic adaptor subunit [Pseudomonadota bacterium]
HMAKLPPHIFPVCLIAGLLLAGCLPDKAPVEQAPEIRPVRVAKTAVRPVEDATRYAGAVQARVETQLAFRVGGKVVARRVEVGSSVQAGDELMRLDPGGQELVQRSVRAQQAAAEAQLEQARSEYKRAQDLLRRKLISRSQFEQQEAAFNTAKARYDQMASQVEEARLQAGYTVLKADRAGVITDVLAETGQVVAAGQPVLSLALPEEKDVVISIPENRLDEFRQAEEVTITLWAEPDRQYQGQVREVAPVADPVTRTYAARITVLDPDAAMHLGMTANVLVRRNLAEAAIRLPLTALADLEDGTPAVWVVDPDSDTVNPQPVTLGALGDEQMTIAGGLEEGLLVVTAGVQKLHPGQKVRVLEDTP